MYKLVSILDYYQLNYEQYIFSLISKGNDFVPFTDVARVLVGEKRMYNFRDLFADVKRRVPSSDRGQFAVLYEKCNRTRKKLNAQMVSYFYGLYD